jgi:transposase
MEVHMSERGRPKKPLILSEQEREALERWARRPKTLPVSGLAIEDRIGVWPAPGVTNRCVAASVRVHQVTVGRWRSRFIAKPLDGLVDEPRPGSPRTVTDDDVEAVIVKTLQETPNDATHWSTCSTARTTGMSQSAICQIWRAFGLKPHLVDTFKLSSDPLFIDKVRDIVGLYMCPPDHAVVLCVDEKTQVQALDRTQPIFPMLPGVPQGQSHDYIRNGTIDSYVALNLATGEVTHQLTVRHRAIEFKKFLVLIDKSVPAGLAVHIVIDNHSTHKTPAIKSWLFAHPRFHVHFTPTSSSWLNLVERWFAEITEKWIRRSTHSSVKQLADSITEWMGTWNEDPKPFVWHKTADEILESLGRYLERIADSGH